ncbi:hypothetical protein OIU85_006293 [Salix viminalis]|uniref:Uncharacterized protein n=1 Tax=Salix viminalis TaxID=40686 RepID=A0A9Q0PKL9_SALVM|nr:hypothetical protein OIU85_006293 [Salix viminalis]
MTAAPESMIIYVVQNGNKGWRLSGDDDADAKTQNKKLKLVPNILFMGLQNSGTKSATRGKHRFLSFSHQQNLLRFHDTRMGATVHFCARSSVCI